MAGLLLKPHSQTQVNTSRKCATRMMKPVMDPFVCFKDRAKPQSGWF